MTYSTPLPLRSLTPWSSFLLAMAIAALMAAVPAAADDGRWTASLKTGQASVDQEFFTGPGTYSWSAEGEDASVGLSVGYRFHRYLRVEAVYTDLGTYSSTPGECPGEVCLAVVSWPDEVQFTGASLSLLPRWPVSETFAVYGKLGVFDWRGDSSPPNEPGQRFGDLSGTDFLGGVGVRWGLPRGIGVQIEYETTDLYDGVNLAASLQF